MRNFNLSICICAILVFLSISSFSYASIIQYSDRLVFESQGIISENYGYENFGTDYTYLTNPWTAHSVTYTTPANMIVGTDTWHNPVSNVFAYNGWSPITANIDVSQQYNMFGLDLAYTGTYSEITFSVFTNIGSYIISGINAPIVSSSQDFYGFIASAGEHFEGFNLASAFGAGSAPVIDNVTLGNSVPIPEPATMLLLGSGLLGLAGLRRKRRKI